MRKRSLLRLFHTQNRVSGLSVAAFCRAFETFDCVDTKMDSILIPKWILSSYQQVQYLPFTRRHFGARGMSSVRYGTRLGDLENKQSTHTLRSALWHEFQKHTKRDQNRCRSAPITDPLRSFEGSGSQTERERAEHTHTHTTHTHTHTSGAEGMYSLS